MSEIRISTVEIDNVTENMREISKSIQETINPIASKVQEINEVIQPVIVRMSEPFESINLQLEPLREHINQYIEEYNKSIQPFMESINSIKETFENIALNVAKIIYKYDFKEIIVSEEDIKQSSELLNYLNENVAIDLEESYKYNNLEDDIVNRCENIILNTQDVSSRRFILRDIVVSIGKEIIKCKEDNTLITKIIIPGLTIISIIIPLLTNEPSEKQYTINNSQHIEYAIENNNYNSSNNRLSIFKNNDIKSECKYIVNKNEIDVVEVVKSQKEWSYIKFNMNNSSIEGWAISDELK